MPLQSFRDKLKLSHGREDVYEFPLIHIKYNKPLFKQNTKVFI